MRRTLRQWGAASGAGQRLWRLLAATAVTSGVLGVTVAEAPPASATGPSISTVVMTGDQATPQITVYGTNLGTAPAPEPSAPPTACGVPPNTNTGYDYGPSGLWFQDLPSSNNWQAGYAPNATPNSGNCIGLVIKSWTATKVVFGFGSLYDTFSTWYLAPGDHYTLDIGTGQYNGTASYAAPSTGIDAFVTNQSLGSTVTRIDTSTGAVSGSPIPVGGVAGPIAVSPDGSRAYVVDEDLNRVDVVDTASGAQIATYPLAGGNPDGIAVSPDGSTLFVSDQSTPQLLAQVEELNAATGAAAGAPFPYCWIFCSGSSASASPGGVAVSPDGSTVYFTYALSGQDHLQAWRISPHNLAANYTLNGYGQQIAISPDGTTAYVASFTGTEAVNLSTAAITSLGAAAAGSQVAVSPDGSTLVAAAGAEAGLAVVATATDAVSIVPLAGQVTGDVAVSPDGHFAWAVLNNGTVVEVDLTTFKVVDTVTDAAAPFGLAITPDQAPAAQLTVTPAPAGSATSFDATASTSATSPIVAWSWNFGDGSTAVTASATTTHVYPAGGPETASVTETDADGTSTTQVFTGRTVSDDGGPSATASQSFVVPSAPPPISVTASLAASSPTVASVETVPESALPASAVEAGASSSSSGNSASAPLRSIPLRSIPLGSIALGPELQLVTQASVPAAHQVLSTSVLSDIGVTYPSGCTAGTCTGWTGILAGTPHAINPLQSTTMADVLANPTAAARFDSLTAADVDVSSSPLGSIPLGSIALGSTPLRSIGLPGAASSSPTDRLNAWCQLLSTLGKNCLSDFGIDPNNPATADNVTLLALSLAGVPLRSIPLRSIPLRSIDFSTFPLRSIPLRSIGVANSPLGSIPLRSIEFATSPLRSIPLRSIDFSTFPLRSIPIDNFSLTGSLGNIGLTNTLVLQTPLQAVPAAALGNNAALVLSCGTSCPPGFTLGDGANGVGGNSILGGAVLADLTTFNGTTLADIQGVLGNADPVILGDLGTYGLGTSNLAALPLRSIPLRSIAAQFPTAFDLDSLDVPSIPDLASIPLRSIPLRSIPLRSIPLRSIASLQNVVDCSGAFGGFTCPPGSTLEDALNAGAILPGANLGELGTYNGTNLDQLGYYGSAALSDLPPALVAQIVALLAPYEDTTVGQLGYYDDATLQDLLGNLDYTVPGFPNVTLSDLLLSLMPPTSYAWNSLNLNDVPLAQYESAGGQVTYTSTVTVAGQPGSVTVALTLPPGFAYRPGSATLDGSALPDPSVNGQALTFVANMNVGPHQLAVTANAGIGLGTTGASVTATAGSSSSSAAATVQVVDGLEPDSTQANATPLMTGDESAGTGWLNMGYLTSATDTNLWSVTVSPQQAGDELALSLSNLPADYDLVLYAPSGDSQQLQGTPAQQAPTVTDAPPSLTPVAQPDQTASDVPLNPPSGYSVFAESANRGTDDENIQTPPLAAGTYYVQVSGYNGADSTQPYVLRGALLPSVQNTCPGGISFPNAMPAPAPAPANYPAGVNTLFLVDTQRLTAAYGAAAEGQVMSAVNAVATDGADGVNGAVVPVDSDPATQGAFATFNNDPCNVGAANGVVKAISSLVDSIRAAHPTVRNLVIVGADDQIPFARLADGATQSNERDYGTSTFAGENNVEADALSQGYYFSDDPYGAAQPLGVGSATLYLPQLAIGRLVETPTQIEASLNRFVSSHGVLDASAALSTGYSFLTSGAQLVAANLAKVSARNVSSLISETWTHSDLDNALAATPAPGLDSINAHFDFSRALPAIGNTTGNQSDLFTTQDVRGAPVNSYAGRLLFSMGCHAGLEVSSFEVAASGVTTPVDDWAKTFADSGALWVANTGYGYGDTARVAYSAGVLTKFADHLDGSETIGAALTDAKQAYAADNAVLSPYDIKSVDESTLYGLPMFTLNSTPPAPPPPPTPLPRKTDPITKRPATDKSIQLAKGTKKGQLSKQTSTDGKHAYYQVNGDDVASAALGSTQTTEYRPIEPSTSFDATQPSAANPDTLGLVAHGALITGLSSTDEPISPLISEPGVDSTANTNVQPLGDTAFPSQLQRVATYQTTDPTTGQPVEHQQVDLVAGQYLPDPANPGTGTQRLFNSISTEVLYTDPSDTNFNPPTIDTTSGYVTGANTDFVVSTSAAGAPIKRVLVLYTDAQNPGAWTPVDLVSSDGVHWSGAGAATASGTLDYMVQAVDGDGNVAVSTNKGHYFPAVSPPAPSPAINISLGGATQVDGYYNGPVTATISGPAGLTYSIDGSTPTPVTGPVAIGGDGAHLLTVTDPAGDTASQVVQIDSQPPVIDTAVSPVPGPTGWVRGGATVSIAAADAGSGLATLSYRESGAQTVGSTTVNGSSADIPVSASGTTVVTVTATDNVGNTASAQVTVNVDATAPTVSCGSPDGNWHGSDVSIGCTASDSQSGLANPAQASFSLSTNVPVGTETANASTPSASVCDNAGNCTTAGPITGNKVDKKPPTLTTGVSGTPVNGWLPPGSVLNASAADGGSGVASITYSATGAQASGPVTVNGSSAAVPLTADGTTTFTVTATDEVGNVSPPQQVTVNVDTAAPTVTCGSPDGNWHGSDVSIGCTASDGQSGLANPAQASFSLTTNVAAGTETANAATNSAVVCDNVGNCTTAGPITGNKVDKKAPAVTITSPTAGTYTVGQSVTASYACTDGGSGVASCVGTVANGAPIPTTNPGTYSFSVTATDNVGNTVTKTVTYTVGYRICLPIAPFELGRTVVFAVQVCNAQGHNVTTPGLTVTAVTVDNSIKPVPAVTDPNNAFFFVPVLNVDLYALNSSKLSTGSHTLQITVAGDPQQHSITFRV